MTPLRLGVVGTGTIAGGHVRAALALPDLAEVVALCDSSPAALARCSARFGITRTYATAEALLAASDIDAVVLCTPHDTHAPLAIAAAEAGKHVLVEKPMASSLDACHAMVAAADAAGVTLMVGQCQRYDPQYRGLKRLLDGGELGTVHAARIEAMQHAAAFVSPGHWYFDGRRAGGGIVISVAVHKLDLLRYLLGDVVRVRATCRTTTPAFTHGAEDLAVATLEFAGGAVGELFASWSAYRLRYSENLMLFGNSGAVHSIPDDHVQMGQVLVASRQRSPMIEPGFAAQFGGFTPVEPDMTGLVHSEPFVNQLAHFVHCCRTGEVPLTSGRDNLGTMATVFAIYTSARTEGMVTL